MQSWGDVMPSPNFDHNWYGNMHIKTEAPDIPMSFPNHHQAPQSNESHPPTSPQSMDSGDSNHPNMFYDSSPALSQLNRQSLVFNPLTPPGYPGLILSQHLKQQAALETTPMRTYLKNETVFPVSSALTPSHTPPMDDTPPKSPKILSETPEKYCDGMDPFMISGDEEERSVSSDFDDIDSIKNPKVNSHGKVKRFKCKQCDFVAVTKMNFWDHTKAHIKPEKMLKCPKCPFVTEYKHHLEYHLRNHDGAKPFQCNKCNYSCVNKSMLNSHLKSHSNVYQYRCTDCNYATKYCHSLKLHLRKYSHKPAMVLNSDGTPNPLPIIDVYGTRRGPKTRPSKNEEHLNSLAAKQKQHQHQQQQQPSQLQSMMPNLPPNLANFFNQNGNNFPNFNYLNYMLVQQQAALSAQLSPNMREPSIHSSHDDESEIDEDDDRNDNKAVDLSQQPTTPSTKLNEENLFNSSAYSTDIMGDDDEDDEIDLPTSTSSAPNTPNGSRNRRKGRAFKLDINKESIDDCEISQQSENSIDDKSIKIIEKNNNNRNESPTTSLIERPAMPVQRTSYDCKFCDISFGDAVLHSIHMGYHGYNDVFKCNMCGEKSDDRIAFFLHIARNPHS